MEDRVKIALVEQKLEDLKPIIFKLDETIDKLSEVNTTVSRMLAVHEERISKSEEIDSVLFAKIDELRDKMDRDHHDVLSRLQGLEKKVWIGIGIIAAVSFVLNNPWVTLSKQVEPVTIQTSYSL
tara:strand:- start:86 stop:460 length:375 start_codon:yes stop_codon:yes gene_type:complete